VRTADITVLVRDITGQADRARAVAIAALGTVAKTIAWGRPISCCGREQQPGERDAPAETS
jgi:hypothetical protein